MGRSTHWLLLHKLRGETVIYLARPLLGSVRGLQAVEKTCLGAVDEKREAEGVYLIRFLLSPSQFQVASSSQP